LKSGRNCAFQAKKGGTAELTGKIGGKKMAIESPVRESSNSLVKPPQVTLACYPARVRLISLQAYSLGFACAPKKQ